MQTPQDQMFPQPDLFGGTSSSSRMSYERPSSIASPTSGLTLGDVGTEGFVLIGMALVTLAVGSALHLHAGLSFTAALTCALSMYLVALCGHSFIHRQSSSHGRPARSRTQQTVDMPETPANDFDEALYPMADGPIVPPPVPQRIPRVPTLSTARSDVGALDVEVYTRPPAPPPLLKSSPASGWSGATSSSAAIADDGPPARPPREADVEMVEALIKKLAEEVNGKTPHSAHVASTVQGASTAGKSAPRATTSPDKKSKPVSIASMASGRSKLSSEAAPKTSGPVTIASQKTKTTHTDISPTDNTGAPSAEPIEATDGENCVNDGAPGPIDVSVAALRTTADAMREGETAIASPHDESARNRDDSISGRDTASSPAEMLPPALPIDASSAAQNYGSPNYPVEVALDKATGADHIKSDPAAFAIIGEALDAGRVDVLLDPILGLDNRRARHFEISLRLRDIDNSVIDTHESCDRLGGIGLSTILDRAAFSRTTTVAIQLEARGRNGAVFSKIAGESMGSEAFVNDVFEAFNRRAALSAQLVMTLTQEHVRMFGHGEWETLRDLGTLGFRFALTSVTDLDMDFEDLSEKGFGFVKLDAEVFLNGLPTGETRIPSHDICSHLAAFGQLVIVEHIDDETVMSNVSKCGVSLGQGQLFGGPRAVKADALKTRPGTAAA